MGCDTFTQLFTQYPEVLEYLADYDTMVAEGINIGEALRYIYILTVLILCTDVLLGKNIWCLQCTDL